MSKNLCFIVTDAISFNVLYRGQLEYLARRGFKITLICGGSVHELNMLRTRKVGAVIDMKFVRPPRLWSDAVSILRLIWYLLCHRFDIVVVTTPKAILLGSVAAGLTLQRRRVVFFQGRVYENFGGLRRSVFRFFDRVAIFCAHEVLFVSHSLMSEFFKETPAVKSKGRVLGAGSGNGVCTQTFSREAALSKSNTISRDLDLSSDDFVVLSVGRICKDKGLAEIASIAERVAGSKVKLVLVGQPEGREADACVRDLVSRRLIRHVPFSQNVAQYFAIASAHLFLSHREGFGNVAIEAAAMNVPTIAYDVVGVRDSVNAGVSGLRVPLGDVDAVIAALDELIDDAEHKRSRFASAREWVVQTFARERVWAAFAEFYESRR